MLEATVNPQILGAVTLLPLLGAVYRIYFKHPVEVSTRKQALRAMKNLRNEHVEPMPLGTHDVTPTGSPINYTLTVINDEINQDTTGQLQVAAPSPTVGFSRVHTEDGQKVDQQKFRGGGIEVLDYGHSSVVVGPGANNQAVKIYGAIICKHKGENVFK